MIFKGSQAKIKYLLILYERTEELLITFYITEYFSFLFAQFHELFSASKVMGIILSLSSNYEELKYSYEHFVNIEAEFLDTTHTLKQGCTSRTSIGNPAIEPPPSGQNPPIHPPLRPKKIPLYLVLKGSKKKFRRLRRRKHP